MGKWGPGLYQNDLTDDIRISYKRLLMSGKNDSEITEEMLSLYNDCLSQKDEAPLFWFALADLQWDYGRLEDEVRRKALGYLNDNVDTLTDFHDLEKRRAVLRKLKQKLLSEQPARKKVAARPPYCCEWKIGDVYAYPLTNGLSQADPTKRFFLFHKIGEQKDESMGRIFPAVRIKLTDGDNLPTTSDEFDQFEYIQVGSYNYEERFYPFSGKCDRETHIRNILQTQNGLATDEFGFLPVYQSILYNTSKRVIPKSLIYVGNFANVKPPEHEFVPYNLQILIWKTLEDELLEKYRGHNMRGYRRYSATYRAAHPRLADILLIGFLPELQDQIFNKPLKIIDGKYYVMW